MKKVMAQTNLFEEIIVDNFAGGGGASTGIELATGRPVTIAINHDPAAILMHRTNHPYTEHLQASVWDVDPVEVCAGRPVGLAWFSPDCKHFSKAKGAALVDRNIRGLAWIVLRWAGKVKPRIIILENVEEFATWGPVRKGKPVRKKAGQTFRKWLQQLQDCGYHVEHRELVAADYGAPTTRKRFVLIARCDGQPIVWPERTHAPKDHPDTIAGKYKPWRAAAEIIDWEEPMYSVFETKEQIKAKYGVNAVRPLADNTMRRIILGVDKYTIRSGKHFLVPTGYGERPGQAPRVHDIEAPLPTIVSTCKQNLVQPVMAPVTFPNTAHSVGSPADQPVHTITTAGNQILAAAELVQCNHAGGDRFQIPDEPLPTIASHHAFGVAAANLIQYHTEKERIATPACALARNDGTGRYEPSRASGLTEALPTVDAANRYGLTAAHLTEYYGNGNPLDLREPMHTVTGHDREALTAVHLDKYYAGGYKGAGNRADEPVTTITVEPRQSLIAAHVIKFKGTNLGQSPAEPVQTITAGGGEFALATVRIEKYGETGRTFGHWPEIRALLNRYCGYKLAEDEILLLRISGIWYFLSDITMRMLTPKELYAAMGFPPDYIIDRDYTGKAYPKNQQVARCGNAVCPPMASAVVRANMPEWSMTITTMAELMRTMAI